MTYEQALAVHKFYYEVVMGEPISRHRDWPITEIKVVGEGEAWGVLLFTGRPLTEDYAYADLLEYLEENDYFFLPQMFGLPDK